MEEKTVDVIEVQEETKLDDEKKWCVYCHTNKINGKKYFGITSKTLHDRWRNGAGYQNQICFDRAINKYTWDGFDHEVIYDNLTEQEAKQKEIELIALYKKNCNRYKNPAYGYNMTDGGEGKLGCPHSEESKIKNSISHIGLQCGEKNGMFGRNHSEESKRKMSEKKKGQNSGVFNAAINPVYSINLDKIFLGPTYAAKECGVNFTGIVHCCMGMYKSAGKHPETNVPLQWKYVYDQTQKDGTIVQGAITLGYVTEEQVNEYLNNLRQKENN